MLDGILSTEAGSASTGAAAPPIAVVNGTLVDGTGGQPLNDAIVIVRLGRIASVGSRTTTASGSGTVVAVPDGATIIDARGGTILPGFVNSHTHGQYREQVLRAWAQAGVTTVRDLAAYPPVSSFALRDELNRDPLNARLVASGPQMTAVGGFVPPGYEASVFIGSPDDALRESRRILDEGADALKVMMESWEHPPMSIEAARVITEAAHARGKRAPVHVTLCCDVERALQFGCDELAHMVVDELSPDLAARVARAGIPWIPTMEVLKGMDLGNLVVDNLRTFVGAGGTVALGTDYGGAKCAFELGMPMKELRWMRDAGMTPMQIVVAATRNAAVVCGLGREIGIVEAGKMADLFVIDGDPLADLDALTRVRAVIRSGIIVRKG